MRRLTRTLAAALPALALGSSLLTAVPAQAVTDHVEVGLYGTSDPTFDGVYRQSLAILGLAAAGRTPRPEAVRWLLDQQCADGSFSSYRSGSTCAPFDPVAFSGGPDSNATAMAVQALDAVGTTAAKAAAIKAATWLRGVQLGDGSWEYTPGGSGAGDPNSTGLVLLALNAEGLVPTTSVVPYYQSLQVGWTGTPAPADLGGISTPWNPGTPDALATVQSVVGPRGTDLTAVGRLTGTWADSARVVSTPPAATGAGVAGWAASWIARDVTAAGPAAYASGNATDAAWAVLSLAADRSAETTARSLEAELAGLPASTSPATNGQGALAAATVDDWTGLATFADRIEASLTKDTTAPSATWTGVPARSWAGWYVTVTRSAASDAFWPAASLTQTVLWGDGSATVVNGSVSRVSHRYFQPGAHRITVWTTDPSGNRAPTTAGTVTVLADTVAPAASVLVPSSPQRRASWARVAVAAGDRGSGVLTVRVRIAQQRNGSWVSWNGRRWIAGTSGWVTATRVTGTTRWTVASPTLALGRLVVTARAWDRSGLASLPSSAVTTLTR
ncbi:MAG TPA: hypothetical protein VFL59_10060 [Candidatus Nanopelagicales bacterium]|nr:hypothetical protein [Candidatus Nanopelagicales bacterium]